MTLFDIKYDDFKREDTTNTIAITLYTDDRQPITPDSSHTWKAKIAKGDKYVGEYPVTISGNTIKLSSSNLTRLPNGDYGLELWETYSGSTTIYPSAGVMEFRVHRNANDTLGTVDPTTDINAIIDDLHKAGQNIRVVATNTLSPGSKASVTQSIANGENQLTFYIPQGPKGEQGDVGPAPTLKIGTVTKLNPDQTPTANLSGGNGTYTLNMGIPQGVQGETNPTATQALDIANSVNSKVTAIQNNGGGRNIGYNTSNDWKKIADNDQWNLTTATFFNEAKVGETYTVNADIQSPTKALTWQVWDGSDAGIRKSYIADQKIVAGATHDCFTFTWPEGKTQYMIVQLMNEQSDSSHAGYQFKGVMLEKGTIAHDWQPNPEEIQSQLDKLKDAVKKLGGDNLAPLVAPTMRNGGAETESITHGHAQRFALPLKGTELLPKTDIFVNVLSGDTLSQSFVIETDATSINGSFTFFMDNTASHHIVPFNVQQLTATKYLISASYTTGTDGKWRILDIMRLNLTGGTYVEFSNPYAAIDLSGG